MASILKRSGPKGKAVWQAQVRKKGYPSKIKTFDRKSDAQSWAKMTEHQMETGLWRDTREASGISLVDALDRYLETVSIRKRPGTQKREELSSRYLKQNLGKLSLTQITPNRVAEYRDRRLQEVSPDSVRLELALLSNLFSVAGREWAVSGLENPVQKIQRPRLPEGRCPILSEEQISLLLEECRRSRTKLLYPFVLLALHTGCRSMELRGLRWSQVNFKDGFVSLVGAETKGNQSQTIPLLKLLKQH